MLHQWKGLHEYYSIGTKKKLNTLVFLLSCFVKKNNNLYYAHWRVLLLNKQSINIEVGLSI